MHPEQTDVWAFIGYRGRGEVNLRSEPGGCRIHRAARGGRIHYYILSLFAPYELSLGHFRVATSFCDIVLKLFYLFATELLVFAFFRFVFYGFFHSANCCSLFFQVEFDRKIG